MPSRAGACAVSGRQYLPVCSCLLLARPVQRMSRIAGHLPLHLLLLLLPSLGSSPGSLVSGCSRWNSTTALSPFYHRKSISCPLLQLCMSTGQASNMQSQGEVTRATTHLQHCRSSIDSRSSSGSTDRLSSSMLRFHCKLLLLQPKTLLTNWCTLAAVQTLNP